MVQLRFRLRVQLPIKILWNEHALLVQQLKYTTQTRQGKLCIRASRGESAISVICIVLYKCSYYIIQMLLEICEQKRL